MTVLLCSWPHRIVQHVFGEIALPTVGAHFGVLPLDVAILAAGDIFGRALLDVVGAAEGVVVTSGIGQRRRSPLEAAGEQWRDQEECNGGSGEVASHTWVPSFVIAGRLSST
jgi:hypothetical protein